MNAVHKIVLFQVLTCLGQNALGGDIIHGEKAPSNSLLHMASVQSSHSHICGGFLISEDFVVTAAHCDLKVTHVVLGAHNLKDENKKVMRIAKLCKHPSYSNVGTGNDIMLLKVSAKFVDNTVQLSGKVQLGERVQVIQLPQAEMNIKVNEMCQVAGWGYTETGGRVVDQLREVNVSIVDLQECHSKWRHLPANVICAGGYPTKEGFCQGDSGGPLICKGMAVGVVSFNSNDDCSYPNMPNVYTNISSFLPWINKILKTKNC